MKFVEILTKHNIKITSLRLELLKILSQSDKPLSYDEILKQVKANKTTIYRSFELFEKCGIIIKSEHDRKAFYELGSGARAYFICDVCHKVTNIDVPNLKEAKSIKSAVIKGVCNTCS